MRFSFVFICVHRNFQNIKIQNILVQITRTLLESSRRINTWFNGISQQQCQRKKNFVFVSESKKYTINLITFGSLSIVICNFQSPFPGNSVGSVKNPDKLGYLFSKNWQKLHNPKICTCTTSSKIYTSGDTEQLSFVLTAVHLFNVLTAVSAQLDCSLSSLF